MGRLRFQRAERGDCRGCGKVLPVSTTTITVRGLLCADCEAAPHGCHYTADPSGLPPLLVPAVTYHVRACPEAPGFDGRRTRTNLDRCPLTTLEVGPDA